MAVKNARNGQEKKGKQDQREQQDKSQLDRIEEKVDKILKNARNGQEKKGKQDQREQRQETLGGLRHRWSKWRGPSGPLIRHNGQKTGECQ